MCQRRANVETQTLHGDIISARGEQAFVILLTYAEEALLRKVQGTRDAWLVPRLVDGPPMAAAGRAARVGRAHWHTVYSSASMIRSLGGFDCRLSQPICATLFTILVAGRVRRGKNAKLRQIFLKLGKFPGNFRALCAQANFE